MFDAVLGYFTGFSPSQLAFLQAARFDGAHRIALLRAMQMVQANMTSFQTTADLTLQYQNTAPFHKSEDEDDPAGPVDIPPLRVLLSLLPLPIMAIASMNLRLGLHNKLAVGALRCAAQLSALGYILVPIFVANKAWLTALYALFMLLVAAAEAVSRPAQSYSGMLPEVLMVMGLACAASIAFGLAAVVQVAPWYDAQYLIPMLGMLLGNACSSVAVGLSAVLDDLSAGKDKVEALLALGASRVEATKEVVSRAARLALTPLLNSMNVVGIVSIPGMMTGQILGGSDPSVASRYQIVIYYLVAISSSASAITTIYAAVFTLCDGKHRLRSEKLRPRKANATGALSWIKDQIVEVWMQLKRGMAWMNGRARRLVQPNHTLSRGERRRHSRYSSVRGTADESRVATPLLFENEQDGDVEGASAP